MDDYIEIYFRVCSTFLYNRLVMLRRQRVDAINKVIQSNNDRVHSLFQHSHPFAEPINGYIIQ